MRATKRNSYNKFMLSHIRCPHKTMKDHAYRWHTCLNHTYMPYAMAYYPCNQRMYDACTPTTLHCPRVMASVKLNTLTTCCCFHHSVVCAQAFRKRCLWSSHQTTCSNRTSQPYFADSSALWRPPLSVNSRQLSNFLRTGRRTFH